VKFNRLRLLGFKSFVEPTEFMIEPGLTGVVGPNGCGKSNLVEALRWVMGESSYKNMRGSGMDDVIFQGSLNRPARNAAEVSLAIDNSERSAPSGFNDSDALEVTRRIEREAGSVYRINGRDVRARDVQLLFADASTGAHSPAIVGQGRIGELIAAKPVDRRALLEEAAGISGLHGRRHEAELRLRAAEQNLARLDDVIAEIEQQFEALKRQARQATRYRNLSGEIRKAEAAVLHLRWQAAAQARAEAEAAAKSAADEANALAVEQAGAARNQAEAAAATPALREEAARAGAALQRIKLASEALDAEEARITGRLAELDRQLAQLGDDIQRERRMIVDNSAVLVRLDEEEKGLEAANAAMAERQASAAAARRAAEAALAESEAGLSDLTTRLASMTAHRAEREKAAREAGARAERLAAEIATVEAELRSLGAVDHAAQSEAASVALASAESDRASAEALAAEAEARLAAARDAATEARDRLAEAERALDRVETEAATLSAVLVASREGGHTAVVEAVSVDAGYEAALAAAFGDDLEAPADTQASAHWREIDHAADEAALPFGASPLAAHVRVPATLRRRLGHTGLVDRADGARLQPSLHPGQRLVSRAGDLWRWDGFVATADAPASSAQRLAQRSRLAALQNERDPAASHVAVAQAERDAGEAVLRSAAQAELSARETLRTARAAVDAARSALADAEREAHRTASRRASLEEAASRLASDLAECRAIVNNAHAELGETAEFDRVATGLGIQRSRVEEDRAGQAEARAAAETIAREADLRSGRLAGIAVERKTWHDRVTSGEAHIATLTARQAASAAERERLSAEPARIADRRSAMLSEIGVAEAARSEAADRLAEGEAALATADKAAREALDRLSESREKRGRAEERAVAARERLADAEMRIRDTLDCPPEQAAAVAEIKPDSVPDLEEIELRLERYRQERERLGGVNLRADEEAREIGQRRDELVAERDDLVAAIHRLRQGIGSLNREGRERLLAAFETVNAHFKRLFTHLFGGGTAELQLTESDDPLEAGLEILARPPGKKPQIMTLLSGGEQALTALSLIFAVFLTNPAPICVLDEVDAPLDDANVERFCNLLDEMTRQTETRFITITHNPITMSRMSRLFGVTMAERGVSQLVSVDLETAERFREAG
jgi:chromosome segregation protein